MGKFKKPIVLTAGGTGGHVFPAQALAYELISQGSEIFMFTDGRGHQFNDSSIATVIISASQLQGSIWNKLRGGLSLVRGMFSALYHLWHIKPCAVVGFGGYASFPTLLAAALLRIPIILHQADAYLGRTNHLLAPFVNRIATSFAQVENISSSCQKKIILTGLPVRPDIQFSVYVPSEENDPFHLLVTGGSQGARVFGEVLPQAVRLLDPLLQRRLHITQQCRSESLEMTQELYNQTEAQVKLSPFWKQMGELYKKSHLIISRAGASSVMEAAIVGRPAIYVPFPYAKDDHQYYNAQQAVHVNGGWLIREKDFTLKSLAILLSDLITSPWKLRQAAVNIQTISVPDASLRLAHLVKLLAV